MSIGISIKEIEESGLFDSEWYRKEFPDVELSGLDPVDHYYKFGAKMGRNPSPSFDSEKYLLHHEDVSKSGLHPFFHYLRYGRKEGRRVISKSDRKLPEQVGCDGKAHCLNQYFDHIYVVNLKSAVKERLQIGKHLSDRGVKFQLWEATNGYEGEPLQRYEEYKARDLGTLKRYPHYNEKEIARGKGFIESAGAFGYIFTYLSILKDAKDNSYDKFLILEDDVILSKDFSNDFTKFVSSVGTDWKVLQLGASQYGWNSFDEKFSSDHGYYYPRQLDTCGSFSIALRSEIIDELIAAEMAFEGPFDHLPLGEIYESYLGKCYVAYPNIVMPDVRDSKIRGGRDQFQHAERMKWVPKKFDFPNKVPQVAMLVSCKDNLKYATSFKEKSKAAINILYFGNSLNGVRPIHDFSDLDWIIPLPSEAKYVMPQCDLYLKVGDQAVIVEEHLEKEVYSRLIDNETLYPEYALLDCEVVSVVSDLVSIIIPTYKRPKNLEAALISVADQSYANKEIIVVNDTGAGSSYNKDILDVVNRVKNQYPDVTIKYFEHQVNLNGAAARNTGLMHSQGEYVCFLDDDDIYLSGRLSATIAELKKEGTHIGAVYCGFLGWNSPENNIDRYKTGDLTKELLTLDYLKHYVHTNTVTYRRDAVEFLNGFDESYRRHQDLEFNIRFFEEYQIGVVKVSGVRLNPAPSEISNKVFNLEMLKLKDKFLGQFDRIISSLGPDVEAVVYQKHWSEVGRYIDSKIDIVSKIQRDLKNGPVQVLAGLTHEN